MKNKKLAISILLMIAGLFIGWGDVFAQTMETHIREKDGMTMIFVAAESFIMGSENGSPDESPMRSIYLDAYWIDQHEVTNAQYAKCVAAGFCADQDQKFGYTRDSYYGNTEFENYPVVNVDWHQAKAYCEWAGGDLPTEAQWEKAARWTDGRTFPWGNEFDSKRVNYCDRNCPDDLNVEWKDKKGDDDYADTSPVCAYPDGNSPYGACDMAGNVWEWTNAWFDENYYKNCSNANPQGPESGEYRVLRGGSWYGRDNHLRAAYRDYYPADSRYSNGGFRCAHPYF